MRPVPYAVTLSGWAVAMLMVIRNWLATQQQHACEQSRRAAAAVPSSTPPLLSTSTHKPIRTFKFKGELAHVLQEEGLRIGVEVGVFEGRFSRWMLDNWRSCTAYYMVDLWSPQEHYRQMDSTNLDENLRRMNTARKQVEPHLAKATLIRNSSVVAAARFADASVDFVYLDARHTYDAVNEDIRAWWPKIRAGGILAGEDYMESDEVWQMTATCDFGPRRMMYPWSGCVKWDPRLPRQSYFSCVARAECENATLGSKAAERIQPPCGSDYTLQSDGTRRRDMKAVRAAVDEFAKKHGRQVQLAYRDPQRAFMWNAWANVNTNCRWHEAPSCGMHGLQ